MTLVLICARPDKEGREKKLLLFLRSPGSLLVGAIVCDCRPAVRKLVQTESKVKGVGGAFVDRFVWGD